MNSLHFDVTDHHNAWVVLFQAGVVMAPSSHNLSCNHGTIRNHTCIMHCIHAAMHIGGSTCVHTAIEDGCTVHVVEA